MTSLKAVEIEPLWSVEQVAQYLGTSRSWVYEKTKAHNGIPAMRVGGLLRFEPDEVRAWARGDRKSTVVALKRLP